MRDLPDDHQRLNAAQVLERVEKMVAVGRIGYEDAARLRAAAASGGLDEAVGEIRRKHAKARIDEALAAGRLSEQEAGVILERLERGENPRLLLRGARQGTARPAPGTAPGYERKDVDGG